MQNIDCSSASEGEEPTKHLVVKQFSAFDFFFFSCDQSIFLFTTNLLDHAFLLLLKILSVTSSGQ